MRKKVLLCLAFFLLSYGMDVAAEEVVGENMVDTVEATEAEETLPILPEAVFGEATTDEADMPTIDPEEDDEEEVVDRTDVTDTTDASTPDKDILYNVSLPAVSTAYLDPGNLSGRGQIFSDQYKIENYGNTDISIKIKDVDIYCGSSERVYAFIENASTDSTPSDSRLADNEHAENDPAVRRLYVEMVWKNGGDGSEKILHVSEEVLDEYVLYLKAAVYDEDGEFVSLSDGGTGFFSFTGTMDPDPVLVWEDDEIVVSFHYEIINTEEEEELEEDPIEVIEETGPEKIVEEAGERAVEGETVPDNTEEKPEGDTAGGTEGETVPSDTEEKPEESTAGGLEGGTVPGNTEENTAEGMEGGTVPDNIEGPEEGTTGTAEDKPAPENGGKIPEGGAGPEEKPEGDTDTGEKEGIPEEDPAGAIEDPDIETNNDQGVAGHEKDTEKTDTEGDLAAAPD